MHRGLSKFSPWSNTRPTFPMPLTCASRAINFSTAARTLILLANPTELWTAVGRSSHCGQRCSKVKKLKFLYPKIKPNPTPPPHTLPKLIFLLPFSSKLHFYNFPHLQTLPNQKYNFPTQNSSKSSLPNINETS